MSDISPTDTSGELLEEVPASTLQKAVAEALGTFVLVLFGCGVAVVTNADVVATALAFGLAVLTMCYTVGRISGGHFNPAITLGAALGGRLAWRETPLYIGSQLVGAILASAFTWVLFSDINGTVENFGANGYGDHSAVGMALWSVLLLEIVLTFIFVMVVLGATDRRTHASLPVAPVAIGLTLSMLHLFAIRLDGTSVNPARSISAALFSGSDAIAQVWLFIVAPLIGGAIAGFLYPALFGRDGDPVPGSGLNFTRPQPAYAYPGAEQWGQQGWNAPQHPGQPGQHPGAQQWQQQPEGWAQQPQQPQAGQWGQPGGHAAPHPGHQPGQQQWAQPPVPPQPVQPPQPPQQGQQQWGQPGEQPGWAEPGEDEGRTQVRPED